jgi:archaemetzincin
MNGVNSLAELDRSTPWLCPLCLRKLHWNIGFDVRKLYAELRAFHARHQMIDEVRWIDRRVARLDR